MRNISTPARALLTLSLLIAAAIAPWPTHSPPAGAVELTNESSPLTFYVRPDGNDAADGQTVATAWRTLGQALKRATAGTTTYVMGGTYAEPRCSWCGSHYRLAKSGTANAWIRVVAYPGQQPEIKATQGTGIELVGSYLELAGFRIRGEGFSATNNWGYGVMYEGGANITIRDNVISGFPYSGIGGTGVSGLTIANNVVFENARWNSGAGSGISVWKLANRGVAPAADGYTDRVVGNMVFANENITLTPTYAPPGQVSDGNGIIVDQLLDSGYTGRVLVANNIAANNGGKGINIHRSSRVDVVHNTLYQNGFTTNMYGDNGDLSAVNDDNVRLINNLVQARPDRVAFLTHDSTNLTVAGNYFSGAVKGTFTGTNVRTTTAPGLVQPTLDPRIGDFHLNPDSAAIDRGIAMSPAIPTDRDGMPRIAGAAPDPGAYERSASPVPSTTTTTSTTTPTTTSTTTTTSTSTSTSTTTSSSVPTTVAPSTTDVVIRARGTVGDEIMVLTVAGRDVATRKVSATFADYAVSLPGTVTIDQVQVRYTNDLYQPPIDRNLEVDWVRVGASTYQAEHAKVAAVGAWTGAGCSVRGYYSTQTLSCNGYFDFQAMTP